MGDLAVQGKVYFICMFFMQSILFKNLLQNKASGCACGEWYVSVAVLVASNRPPVLTENH